MKILLILLLIFSTAFAKRISLKTAVEDKSIYGQESNINEIKDSSNDLNKSEQTSLIKTPKLPKKDVDILEEVTEQESKSISTHEKFKKEFKGGNKINVGYNKNLLDTLKSTIPNGAQERKGGGDGGGD